MLSERVECSRYSNYYWRFRRLLGKEGFGKSCTEYNFINEELQKFAFEQDNCYFVTASDLTSNPDGIHINAISQRKFGYDILKPFLKDNMY